jgi:hypothetical protein
MLREGVKAGKGQEATHLCRLLFQLEQSFVGELLFPLLPLLRRQLRAVLHEHGLDLPQALERHLREVFPDKSGRLATLTTDQEYENLLQLLF